VVEVSQGEVWWADLPAPGGSAPGFRRPVVVVQGDALNRSRLGTVVCIPLTSNLAWATAPGCTPIPARTSGLGKDSIARAAQLTAIDRDFLVKRAAKLPPKQIEQLLASIDIVLGR
jgi:mRNA interferase MazF